MSPRKPLFHRKRYLIRRARADLALHSELQETLCEELLERLAPMRREAKRVLFLESGAAPGLAQRFREAAGAEQVVCADTSYGLAARAAKAQPDEPRPVIIDPEAARLPFRDHSFDIIAGYAPLQFSERPDMYLRNLRRCLAPKGLLLLCFIGDRSLQELRQTLTALETRLTGRAAPRVMPMIDVKTAGRLLQEAGFRLAVSDKVDYEAEYDSIYAALAECRACGAGSILRACEAPGKAVIAALKEKMRNGYVVACHAVILTGEA